MPYLISILFLLELTAVVGSWVCSVLWPEWPIVSMLTPEGVRWFIGDYAKVLATPLVVDIIIGGIAYGALMHSGLVTALRSRRSELSYQKRVALQLSALVLIVCICVVSWLAFSPHAIMLSATGALFPSTFADGFPVILAFVVTITALTYGGFSNTLLTLRDVIEAFSAGIRAVVPLLLSYIFAAHLVFTLLYIIR